MQNECVSSSVISDFAATLPTLTANPKYAVIIGMDVENPFDMAGQKQAVVVIWNVKPQISETERANSFEITIAVGHADDQYEGNAPNLKQRGKLNNADFAEVVAKFLCGKLQKTQRAACSFAIDPLLDNYFPLFVHQINISMRVPKSYREPQF